MEASPGVVGQDKARMIGIPLLLQVVAINPVVSQWGRMFRTVEKVPCCVVLLPAAWADGGRGEVDPVSEGFEGRAVS